MFLIRRGFVIPIYNRLMNLHIAITKYHAPLLPVHIKENSDLARPSVDLIVAIVGFQWR